MKDSEGHISHVTLTISTAEKWNVHPTSDRRALLRFDTATATLDNLQPSRLHLFSNPKRLYNRQYGVCETKKEKRSFSCEIVIV